MAEDAALLQKRIELKRELASGQYRVLASVILGSVGRRLQKISRHPTPIPFWYNGLVVMLVTLIIALATSLLLGESPTPEMLLISIWAAAMGYLVVILSVLFDGIFLSRRA